VALRYEASLIELLAQAKLSPNLLRGLSTRLQQFEEA